MHHKVHVIRPCFQGGAAPFQQGILVVRLLDTPERMIRAFLSTVRLYAAFLFSLRVNHLQVIQMGA